ncbi:MAG: hypothetical protein A4E57_00304 [Syntrophorhabdaceae bacterium PtaU1.Bin034]|nr:MAG: hypothetical protein A4E57_00304 [Syntrophorhabdaceae bacterium PtaU1.Bin034]
MRKKIIFGILSLGIFLTSQVYAHTPLCSCFDSGDGTITCEGGFSDGSSAAGVSMEVRDAAGKTLTKGRMDKLSTFTFKKPATGAYKVVFDAGPGHVVEVDSKDITE